MVINMKRPKVALFVSASLDGRITLGPNLTMFDMDERHESLGTRECWESFTGRVKEMYKPQLMFDGSNMVVKNGAELRELPAFEGDARPLYQDFLPSEVVNNPERIGWLGLVDGRGRFRNGYRGEGGWHIIHFTTLDAPPEYLAFLRMKNIPYLVCGRGKVDLTEALAKARDILGVESAVTSSGGRLSGALLRAGLLDEVNVWLNPVVIGGFETPSLFDSPELAPEEWPAALELISAEPFGNGGLWLRYRVK
jgi:riboflavin biosynthesis pyrimidine reductase